MNSNYDKATSCKNYVERESKHTSLVKKAEIVALERNSGSLNKTFDAEITVEAKTEFTSRLQYSPKSKSEQLSAQLSLRNNNEISNSSRCHSTPMKGIGKVVGCNNSSYSEINNEVFSEKSPVLSPSPATRNKPVRSNLSFLDYMGRDASGTDIIDDATN